MITSGFLVCCELYGWTTSGHKSSPPENSGGDEKREASVRNGVISEEDFPTLSEWLDDRDVLYKERSRWVQSPPSIFVVATVIDFIAINFDPVPYLGSYP